MNAPRESAVDRFLRYVQYDTQSDETSTTYPSTEKQLVLLRDLAAELRAVGLTDAEIDGHGYVMATIPALGYQTYFVRPAAKAPASHSLLKASEDSLENEFIHLKLDAKTGCVQLYEAAGRELDETVLE